MADGVETGEVLRRLAELEPNDLESAVALYGDCIEVFGRDKTGKPRVPEDVLSMLMRKFEDPRPLVTRCAELARASN